MNRRTFLKSTLAAGAIGAACTKQFTLPAYETRTLTKGPKHHFFGYYGICPWNQSQKYLLSLESPFQDHLPSPEEAGAIGLVDAQTGDFEKVTETRAWNLQQGAMMYWNPKNPEYEFFHNDRREEELVSVLFNTQSGAERILPRPISALSHNGDFALSLTYGRLGRLRKVVGYQGAVDPNPNDPHPDNDGVFYFNLETGETKLVVSIRQVYEMLADRHPELRDQHMWFNHVVINKSDQRFFFLARIRKESGGLQTGMFTVNVDGSDLREAIPYGKSVSHFDWRNDREIVATFKLREGDKRTPHVLFTDGKNDYKVIGEELIPDNGHCSFSPDQQWLLTDQKYGSTLEEAVFIYNVEHKQGAELARIHMFEKRYFSGDTRCDLHPRWDRTGSKICFDGLDQNDGTRQMYIIDLDFV